MTDDIEVVSYLNVMFRLVLSFIKLEPLIPVSSETWAVWRFVNTFNDKNYQLLA